MRRNKLIQAVTILLCSTLFVSLAAPAYGYGFFVLPLTPTQQAIANNNAILQASLAANQAAFQTAVQANQTATANRIAANRAAAQSSSSSSNNDGLIIGAVVLVAVFAYYMYKRKKRASATKEEDIQALNHRQITKNMSLTVDSLLIDSLEESVSADEFSVEDIAGARLSVHYRF